MSFQSLLPSGLRHYQYDKIRNDEHKLSNKIRLVKLLPPRSPSLQTPELSIGLFDLEGEFPPYTALSYTWGPAQIQSVKKPEQTNPPNPPEVRTIMVNSSRYDVQLNLFDALCHLGIARPGEYVWIDAVCINQSDNEEKAEQVAMMDIIYKRASKTTVWLGKASPHTARAVDLLSASSQVARHVALTIAKLGHWTEPPHRSDLLGFQQAGLPQLQEEDWKALEDIYSRRYFGRVWMMQEVALSRQIEVVCGHLTVNWAHIAALAIFLFLNRSLFNVVRDPSMVSPIRLRMAMGIVNTVGMHVTRLRCGTERDAAMMAVVNHFNWTVSTDSKLETFGSVLFALLQMNSAFAATDTRDMIYAHYGILKHICPDQTTNTGWYKPNYKLTEAEVLFNFCQGLILETGMLHMLAFAGDSYPSAMPGLPSWAPGFVGCHPVSLHGEFAPSSRFPSLSALGPNGINSESWNCISVIDGMRLHVRAHHVAQVAGLGETWSEMLNNSIKNTMQMLLQYVAPIYPYTNQSRTEAFWRTLVFDRDFSARPASAELGKSFSVYLGLLVLRSYVALVKTGVTHQEAGMVQDAVDSLARMEQPVGQFFPTWPEIRLSLIQLGWIPAPPDGSVVKAADTTAITDMLVEKAMKFETVANQGSLNYRRTFATDYGHLGCGPQSIVAGDAVWIVAGCPSPLVLRKLGNESYQVIGEAYVHGIMSGEAVAGNVEWKNICLI
jgi:hypothetical protein